MFRTIIHIVVFLTLTVLIGSVAFFGIGVAGVVFQPDILPSRTLSGAVNAAVLHRLNVVSGAAVAVLSLALAYLAFASPRGTSRVSFGLVIPLLLATLYTTLILFPEINGLRLEIGDFDHILAAKEPVLERFHQLHGRYSKLVQGGLIASVLILIFHVIFITRRADPATRRIRQEEQKSDVSKSENLKDRNSVQSAPEPTSTVKKAEPRSENGGEREKEVPEQKSGTTTQHDPDSRTTDATTSAESTGDRGNKSAAAHGSSAEQRPGPETGDAKKGRTKDA